MPDFVPASLLWAETQLGRLAGLFAVLGSIALLGLTLITVVAVFWRYVLNDPIFGLEDVSSMSMTVVVAAAVAFGAYHGAHVNVSVIKFFAGRAITRFTDALARSIGFVIVGIATYAVFTKGTCGLECGAITNNLSIVHTPFYFVLGFALLAYALLLFLQLLIGLAHWRSEDPNEPAD